MARQFQAGRTFVVDDQQGREFQAGNIFVIGEEPASSGFKAAWARNSNVIVVDGKEQQTK
jgi:hypothetical protein